jgi:hypothetical protein
VGSIPIFRRDEIKLEPFEEKVNDDVIEEGFVLKTIVIFGCDGNWI